MDEKIPKEIEDLAEELSGSYWNYRWLKIVVEVPKIDDNLEVVEGETEEEVYYELHEVYYDENEKPFMWSEEAERIYTEDAEEMMEFISKMLDAAMKKVLIVKNGKIKETKEYMLKSEILKNKVKEKMHEKKARRN